MLRIKGPTSAAFSVLVFLLFPMVDVLADPDGFGDPVAPSTALSARLFCQSIAIYQSSWGMLAGLIMAMFGLYVLIRKGALRQAILLIIGGALISALPSLIISGLSSFSTFLVQQKISVFDISQTASDMLSATSNCEAIKADWSAYDDTTDTGSANSSRTGFSPQATMRANNAPNPSAPGPISEAAKKSPPGSPGCMDLVNGGQSGSPFGPRAAVRTLNGNLGSTYHRGVDIRCSIGSAVYAAAAGTVVRAERHLQFGNMVMIRANNGSHTLYAHMNALNMRVGQTVTNNQVIGPCGQTGNASGPHMHFQFWPGGDTGKYAAVDPVANGCGHGG